MKKQWLSLLFVALLMLAPIARADDGGLAGSFAELLGQLVALFSGDELGEHYPPNGQPADGPNIGNYYPPGGDALNEDDPELGNYYPPGG